MEHHRAIFWLWRYGEPPTCGKNYSLEQRWWTIFYCKISPHRKFMDIRWRASKLFRIYWKASNVKNKQMLEKDNIWPVTLNMIFTIISISNLFSLASVHPLINIVCSQVFPLNPFFCSTINYEQISLISIYWESVHGQYPNLLTVNQECSDENLELIMLFYPPRENPHKDH